MDKSESLIWNTTINRRFLPRWVRSTDKVSCSVHSAFHQQSLGTAKVRRHFGPLIRANGNRRAPTAGASQRFPMPHNTDWFWRPEAWRLASQSQDIGSVQDQTKFGDEVTLFHDCDNSDITLRQFRNMQLEDTVPYGLRLDLLRFDGGFLSVVLDLPKEPIVSLTRDHILMVNSSIKMSRTIRVFVRLNIKHGPNTETLVRELQTARANASVEFDLAYSKINEKRIERAWVDVIFENPETNVFLLRDLTFSRHPRANI